MAQSLTEWSDVEDHSGLKMRRKVSNLNDDGVSLDYQLEDAEIDQFTGGLDSSSLPSPDGVAELPGATGSPPSSRRVSGNDGSASGAAQPRNFWNFFWSEFSHGYDIQNDSSRYTEKRKKVYAFIQIPKELETFLFCGFLQCCDAFLYFFTFLPLRFIFAVMRCAAYPCTGSIANSEVCDIIKVVILIVSSVVLLWVDTSVVYHLIRGQSVIKLYIFFNMLEVVDKLFSSFGQDILDALFWTATEAKSRRRYFPHLGTGVHLAIAIVYVSLHTILVLFQATTLNVAFNSHNKALLTIMISNNFVELKGSVFKKFAKSNLFQMACSDVRERFHYVILLSIVVIRNMTAVNWKADHFYEMVPDLVMVLFGELLVDWVKHAFITKFNEIPCEVYKDFTITISYDAVRSRAINAFSDHSDQVSRRMGFIPLPLTVLLIRIVSQSFSPHTKQIWFLLGLGYITLVTLKLLNSILLLGKASKVVQQYESMQNHVALWDRIRAKKSKSVPASPKLSLIEFNDVMQQSHVAFSGMTYADLQPYLQQMSLTEASEVGDSVEGGLASVASPAAKLQRSHSVAGLDVKARTHAHTKNDSEASSARQHAGVSAKELINSLVELKETQDCVESSVPSSAPKSADEASCRDASPTKQKLRVQTSSECESLKDIDRYTLLNNDRIEP